MRLIDVDALLKQLAEVAQRADEDAKYSGNRTTELTWDMAVKYIQNAPTIESERKRGKWIDGKDIIIRGTCSCCGWDAITDETDVLGMPFCPNCGAEMGKEE